jgi:hypothetical protein
MHNPSRDERKGSNIEHMEPCGQYFHLHPFQSGVQKAFLWQQLGGLQASIRLFQLWYNGLDHYSIGKGKKDYHLLLPWVPYPDINKNWSNFSSGP